MSSLVSKNTKLKFLLDENVKKELLQFLKEQGLDVIFKPKGVSNGKLAEYSKSEQRVLITNDGDFVGFNKEEIFAVVWLRIPQDKPKTLLDLFSRLLKKNKTEEFKGKLIILHEGGFEVSPLSSLTPA